MILLQVVVACYKNIPQSTFNDGLNFPVGHPFKGRKVCCLIQGTISRADEEVYMNSVL